MSKSRFHFSDLADDLSTPPMRHPRSGEPRCLSPEEIAALYPGVSVDARPLTHSEKWDRLALNIKSRRKTMKAKPRW